MSLPQDDCAAAADGSAGKACRSPVDTIRRKNPPDVAFTDEPSSNTGLYG